MRINVGRPEWNSPAATNNIDSGCVFMTLFTQELLISRSALMYILASSNRVWFLMFL